MFQVLNEKKKNCSNAYFEHIFIILYSNTFFADTNVLVDKFQFINLSWLVVIKNIKFSIKYVHEKPNNRLLSAQIILHCSIY